MDQIEKDLDEIAEFYFERLATTKNLDPLKNFSNIVDDILEILGLEPRTKENAEYAQMIYELLPGQ